MLEMVCTIKADNVWYICQYNLFER
uniref:Uncharacterized protein n=1 Tax=Arundo donax TaxID=35708 RepID=A0A0A9BEF5_ARUDO